MPESVHLLNRLVGADATATLVNRLGGTTFPFSKNRNQAGKLRHGMLSEMIGEEKADILTRHFHGEVISIPNCKSLERLIRNQKIISAFDSLSQGMSASKAVEKLSMTYGLTDRHVWSILKDPQTPRRRQPACQ
ncbi:Mor transcription activator family protein [Laribacter hongkongensis]|uniref:DNA transposition protein n=1 Tax=Laribacter hongkongensis TaxID=168471 RepID=A0ABD4SX88_9NEIS|nr:Mor transcription activator family protein [Laribacter hongkongensis]MCG9027375.1 DNA transposition protein [Laribacter hongkongensis]